MADKTLENIQIDGANLWKEEHFTDLKVGNIRKLTPIKLDGTEDESRTAVYSATTNIMTPGGALPISGEIEATTLSEAVKNFPAAINAAIKQLQEEMIRMQQEQASQIITPDQLRGKGNIII
ncbi:MAG: hypothetical protein K9M54_09225 [Kiritimatiellales bacterium]|nr:hypothetical protein [Kiritimatiellales bacterium]MCF7864344.1 hypothetical protein [Kiritimatiellales bacterium]